MFHHAVHPYLRMVVLLALWLPAGLAWALETVTLQLKWKHGFQFAGYYAAAAKGYYQEVGLDVQLQEAAPGTDTLNTVMSGQADYGVGTSSLLLARQSGQPVVVLAVIFQHSPLVLLARRNPGNPGTQSVHDLVGKRVMIEPQSDELFAYLKQEGIAQDLLVSLPHSFQVQNLIDGRVDAMSAYVTNEPYDLDRAGLDYLTYTPRAVGIDFYGDNLFTTEQELKNDPDRVRAFRAASLRGWHYAMDHPEEMVDLIATRYAKPDRRDFLTFEAKRMEPLLRTDLVEAGYMNRGRWRHIVSIYADLDLLPRDFSLDGFLYEPEPRTDWTRLYLALGLLAVVSAVAFYIHRINRRLSAALADSHAAAERIRHMAQHDPLTDLPNRALLSDRLSQALAEAKRDGSRLALVFMDLDGFKPVNDQLGHAIGDRLLQQVALRLRACVRESDTVARVGGDEFVVVLRQVTDASKVLAVVDKLRTALTQPFEIDRHPISVGASLGVALYPEHGLDDNELLKRADEAMYRAKNAGRNQVVGLS